MSRPQNATELRMFIDGEVNYYRDMWPSESHVLKLLTDISGKAKLNWTPAMQTAFDKIQYFLAADVLSTYQNHNKRFDIFTDASDFQMGGCIMQDGCPVAHFSHKLNRSEQHYTTMEKEMLSIVANTLDEFCSMLLGANVHVFADHKNLTFDSIKTQRVLCWRNKVEEFSPILHYIEGPKNILADNLLRLHLSDDEDADSAYCMDHNHKFSGVFDDEVKGALDCYLNLPESDNPEQNPLSYAYI
ncbi:hypothetical protein ACHAXR_003151 [Thalassiosira sp. AJA248-18]